MGKLTGASAASSGAVGASEGFLAALNLLASSALPMFLSAGRDLDASEGISCCVN
jgi:hypothetical protein